MKKVLFISLFPMFLFSQSIKQAYKMDQMPVFDGVEDTNWNAPWENINQVWIPYNNILPSSYATENGTQTLNGVNDFSARYKVMWNDENDVLLFYVEVQDDIFVDGYTKPNGDYPNYDILEFFIDENKSGGNHLFDSTNTNAENAFAYHIAVNKPAVNTTVNTMVGAMDNRGTTWGNIVDYQSHFLNFAFRNYGNGKYVYELAIKLYGDNYDNNNPQASLKTLSLNKSIGLSIAYCDNDAQDGKRDHFIGSVPVTGENNNNSYIDASIFGTLNLTTNLLNNASFTKDSDIKIFPNPFKSELNIQLPIDQDVAEKDFQIYNSIGQLVREFEIKNHSFTIDMKNLLGGIYFYKIIEKGKILDSGRLVSE
jgi:hypothetical protein